MRRAGIGVVLAALAAGGCGGGGAGGGALSHEDYVKQANALCSRLIANVEALPPGQRSELQAPAHNLFYAHVSRMKKLAPPESDRGTVDEFLLTLDQKAKTLKDIWDAARAHDGPLIKQLYAQGSRIDKESDSLARKLGLDVCAKGP
ncbi:MAG TPA: hypothetical protein VF895_03285 [Gaiellaceae bacterium]